MGEHRNGRVGNVLAWSAVGVVIVLDVGPARGRGARARSGFDVG